MSHDVEVVVTGIGCVCPTLSEEQRQRWFSGIDSSWIEPAVMFPENKSLRLLSRDGTLAVIAARRAMLHAGLQQYESDGNESVSQIDPSRMGLFGATGMMSFPEKDLARLTSYSIDDEGRFDARRMGAEALRRTRPILSFKILGNMPICFVSIFENIQGPNNVYAPTEAQAGRAMKAGYQAIVCGDVDIALAGATDAKASSFDRASLIRWGCGEKETGAAGQLDASESSLIDEAAVFLVFERKDSAEKRGAKILASVDPETIETLFVSPAAKSEIPERFTMDHFAATRPLRAVSNIASNFNFNTQVSRKLVVKSRSKRTVVVTGLGVATPLGCTVDAFWSELLAGRSGLGQVTHFDASTFPTSFAAEITDQTSGWSEAHRELQNLWPELCSKAIRDRKVFFALTAALQAAAQSGLEPGAFADAVLCLGVGLESIPMQVLIDMIEIQQQRSYTSESMLPVREPVDLATRLLGNRFGFGRGRHTNVSACAAGAMAIGEAYRLIASDEVSLAMCGGSDSMINPLGLGGFGLLGVLAAGEEDCPPVCRPFHRKREGTLIGEGAAMLVLESEASARRRGAAILCEVAGFASTMDAKSVTDPALDGRGIIRCMENAVADAGLQPGEIDTINAHATGTVTGDQVEAEAIQKLFGDRRPLPVSAIKAQMGHTIGASGAIEAVASVLTLCDQIVPQTVGLDEPDARCPLDHVIGGPRRTTIQTVLSNSFGLGGQNGSLVFRRFLG